MKKIILTMLLIGLPLFVNSVFADVAIKAKEEVEGAWDLKTTKNSLNDRRPATREDTWVFKDGTVTIMHIPREGTYYDQPPVPYEVQDGKLKVTVLGGSRFDLYSVVELTDKAMTLKGKYGDYNYFTKK